MKTKLPSSPNASSAVKIGGVSFFMSVLSRKLRAAGLALAGVGVRLPFSRKGKHHQPRKLKKFHEIYKHDLLIHLLVGNGLLMQLGYPTSSKNILWMMAKKYPELYDQYYRTIPPNFEFEQIFVAGLPVKRDVIMLHFAEALVAIVGSAMRRQEDAIRFIGKFDSVVSLNFDLVVPLAYSSIAKYSLELLVADALAAYRDKYGTDGIQPPKFEIMENAHKPGRGEFTEGKLRAVHEEGLTKYDYLYGRLRPAEGFVLTRGRWEWKEKKDMNCLYPHGSLFVYVDVDGKVCKLDLGSIGSVEKHLEDLLSNEYCPLLVVDSDKEKKKTAIAEHRFLEKGVEALGEMEGSLVVYGLGIDKDTDKHLWDEIDNNKALHTVYVARGSYDEKDMERLKELLPKKEKIVVFDQEL